MSQNGAMLKDMPLSNQTLWTTANQGGIVDDDENGNWWNEWRKKEWNLFLLSFSSWLLRCFYCFDDDVSPMFVCCVYIGQCNVAMMMMVMMVMIIYETNLVSHFRSFLLIVSTNYTFNFGIIGTDISTTINGINHYEPKTIWWWSKEERERQPSCVCVWHCHKHFFFFFCLVWIIDHFFTSTAWSFNWLPIEWNERKSEYRKWERTAELKWKIQLKEWNW